MSKGNFKYSLEEILFLAIACTVSGLTNFEEMQQYGEVQLAWFRKFYPYKHGMPSHDTINRLFAILDPDQFCKYFVEWVASIRKDIDNEVIAIDGKAVKGSAEPSKGIKALQFVSAYAAQNELVLAQQMIKEKSNEITAVPILLDMIDCKGAIITVDALNSQTDIAAKIIDKKGNYIFAIKKNQGDLLEQIQDRFEKQTCYQIHKQDDIHGGRVESRMCKVISDLTFVDNAYLWAGIKSIAKVETSRYFKSTGKTETESRYYITSLNADAELINKSVRQHWSIENKLHWMLDVSFKEDASRKRKNHSTRNYGLVCKIALNLIKQQVDKKPYSRQKFRALISNEAREKILGLV